VRIAAGEAFYCVPCHVSGWDEDAELIVFSPLGQMIPSSVNMGRVLADFDDRSRRWQGALSPTRRSVPSSADLGARAIARRPA